MSGGNLLKQGLEEQYQQACAVCGCCVVMAGSALRILHGPHSWHLADLYKYLINVLSPSLHCTLHEGKDCFYLFITLSPVSCT